MPSYRKNLLAAKSIVSRFCKLIRRPRQSKGRAAQAPDETSIVADGDQPQAAETPPPLVNEDFEPRLAGDPPPGCSRLYPGEVKVLGDHPASAGAFTDIWDGSLAGDPVVIKSYRIYSTGDPTQARMRHYKEGLACSRLSHRNIVRFRATYATAKHPLALVYDFVGHRDLGEYIRNDINGDIGRVRLLADVARGLCYMHGLDIIHGNLRSQNILVGLDGTARIAGLGSAFIPSQNHVTWAEMDAELLFYGTAPELVRPNPRKSSTRTTKESDVYAFAILAWEVFAGQVPFSNMNRLAAFHILTTGARPLRPHHPELSDRVWDMVQECWHSDPSRRIKIKDVILVLATEIPGSPSA